MSKNELTARLRAAGKYIVEYGWTQHTMRNADGKVCLTGAVQYCAPKTGDAEIITTVLQSMDRAEHWNDRENRTEADVLAFIRDTDITDALLERTFGPQWAEIVALVRRVATLTDAENKALGALRDENNDSYGALHVWRDSRVHAQLVSRRAFMDRRQDSARKAAGEACTNSMGLRFYIRAFVNNTSDALAARHLIGTKFTQEHYDTLTRPWALIIGKVHPDDADVIA